MLETINRVNRILFDERASVTTTPATIMDLFTIKDRFLFKTIQLWNHSTKDIYFGADATISASTAGGVIKAGGYMDMPLMDVTQSPYFVSASSASLGIIVWS